MTRKLTAAIAGMVALALVLSGLFTLLLVRRSAREETRSELAAQAVAIAERAGQAETFQVLNRLGRALHFEGLARVVFTPRGQLAGELPPGITPADLDVGALRAGQVVSGVNGHLAFAAAPVTVDPPGPRPPTTAAVVLTREVDAGLVRGATWFAVSGAATLALAVVVANGLGRRFSRPLLEAERTTRRIAAGDLDARVNPDASAGEEVASLGASINAMAAELARSRGVERQFLLSVSHDLRTPLTSIRGFAEAIADGAAADHERAAGVIAAESRRLERLVADLLELAKLDARRFSLDLRPVDVAEVVADTAEGFRPAAAEAGLELRVDTPRDRPLRAVVDADRLAQVVANLVENALKFAASTVAVACGPAGETDTDSDSDADEVVVVVDDDGPGISEADLGRVFERLYQPPRAPARAVGSGLGLAIVAELVHAMGGTVRALPASTGTGTRVVVRLPAARR